MSKTYGIASLIAIASLTMASFYVVGENAVIEPYIAFRHYDAVMQVGVGSTLMFLWFFLQIIMIRWAFRSRTLVSVVVSSPVVLWAVICEFYLYSGITGYLGDISHFVLHQT